MSAWFGTPEKAPTKFVEGAKHDLAVREREVRPERLGAGQRNAPRGETRGASVARSPGQSSDPASKCANP
jgi:hypothetical protein